CVYVCVCVCVCVFEFCMHTCVLWRWCVLFCLWGGGVGVCVCVWLCGVLCVCLCVCVCVCVCWWVCCVCVWLRTVILAGWQWCPWCGVISLLHVLFRRSERSRSLSLCHAPPSRPIPGERQPKVLFP